MAIPGLIKTYDAEGDIQPRRIVGHGTVDYSAKQAGIGREDTPFLGVSEKAATIKDGSGADIIKSGLAQIEYGGVVSAGDLLTSDAEGKAVVAKPAVGKNKWVVGIAEVSGVAGDFGLVHISIGRIQG